MFSFLPFDRTLIILKAFISIFVTFKTTCSLDHKTVNPLCLCSNEYDICLSRSLWVHNFFNRFSLTSLYLRILIIKSSLCHVQKHLQLPKYKAHYTLVCLCMFLSHMSMFKRSHYRFYAGGVPPHPVQTACTGSKPCSTHYWSNCLSTHTMMRIHIDRSIPFKYIHYLLVLFLFLFSSNAFLAMQIEGDETEREDLAL